MKRRLLIIVSSFIAILGFSIGGFYIVQRSPKLQNTVAKLANVQLSNTNTTITKTNTTQPTTSKQVAEVRATARIFAERYGSTSNQNPAGLTSVLAYCTSRLAGIIQANIDDLVARPIPSVIVTNETKAYVVEVTAMNGTQATAKVSTVREEAVGSAPVKTTRQDLTVQLVREGSAWRVDQAQWGDATAYGN